MNWLVIIQLLPVIMELINKCNTDDDVELARRIKNPGPFATVILARELAETRGIRGREWRQQRRQLINEVRDTASNMTDDEAMELVRQLRQGAV